MRFYTLIHIIAFNYFSFCSGSIDNNNNNDEKVNYYMTLISEGLNNVNTYRQPNSSRDFLFKESSNNNPKVYGTYDFIIIGGGSAGSVVANRLSEISGWNILLIEAGYPGDDLTDIPQLFWFSAIHRNYSWGYSTVPQTTCCLGYTNNKCPYQRGKALGGSSTINAMIMTRGNKVRYDEWANMGNPGWSYDEVFPYFLKLEDSHVEDAEPGFHHKGGPMYVQTNNHNEDFANIVLESARELDREILDYNGRNQKGYSKFQTNIKKGKRWSTEKAYLRKSKLGNNLKIVTNALVTKINIRKSFIKEKCSTRATGINFIHNGHLWTAGAKKEVILSAGFINSPQLLLLSGIGPKPELKKHNIPTIKDLPVGKNYRDNNYLDSINFKTNFNMKTPGIEESIREYVKSGTGVLSASIVNTVGYVNFCNKSDPLPSGEHIFTIQEYSPVVYNLISNIEKMTKESLSATLEPYENKTFWTSAFFVMNTKSEGKITLSSSNPLDFPLIDPNMFSDEEDYDLNTMVNGIKDMFKISNTKAFKSMKSKYKGEKLPHCKKHDELSDDYWKCYVRHLAKPGFHGVGTCKMGPSTDKTSVVDSKLKVHGIERLRVIDASVIPFSLTAHTNNPVIMIAEKASDIIKIDHNMPIDPLPDSAGCN